MAKLPDPVHQAFEDAIRDFKTKLADDLIYRQILQTTSIDQVYDTTDKIQEEQRKKGHLRHLSKIEPYLNRLNEYASSVEVFVQIKPDILALIWGPIRLLLQWASVLKMSFDAIINTTSDIGQYLPEFKLMAELFPGNAHINDILVLFFKDILEFYLIAFRFFKLTRWKILFESLWPRHKDKIDVVIRLIQHHVQLLRNGVRLEDIQQAHIARQRELEHFETSAKARRRQEYIAIKTDISPVFYNNTLDDLRDKTYEGTGEWLMTNSTYLKWLDQSDDTFNILWVEGIPGSGKTFVSSIAVGQAQKQGRTAFAFLSFRDSRGSSALDVLQSLTFQLVSRDEDLQSLMIEESHGDYGRDMLSTVRILHKVVDAAGPSFFVIDGLDEIGETDRSRLLKELISMAQGCSNLRILISSRPASDLNEVLRKAAKAIRVDHHNAMSIHTFVKSWVDNWFVVRGFEPRTQAEIRKRLSSLSSKAQGMFLYARIILDSIEYISSLDEIYEETQLLPDSLDDAYKRVLCRVNSLNPSSRIKARNILGWAACSPTPMSIQELSHALAMSGNYEVSDVSVIGHIDFVRLCGPIIEVNDNYVQFVHFTVKEYITSPVITGYIPLTDATKSLAEICLAYLRPEFQIQELCDACVKDHILRGAYAFHNYTARTFCELVTNAIVENASQGHLEGLLCSLNSITSRGKREGQQVDTPVSDIPRLKFLKKEHQGIYELLCQLHHFYKLCYSSDFHLDQGDEWAHLDPLRISETSTRIHKAISRIAHSGDHKTKTRNSPNQLRNWHGPRPFLCGYFSCRFGRYGFESFEGRDSHEKSHDRPWTCPIADCQYAKGGFLSRRMRDDHLEHFHREPDDSPLDSYSDLVEEEFILDSARANERAALETYLPHFVVLSCESQIQIMKAAASAGSVAALDILVKGLKGENGAILEAMSRYRSSVGSISQLNPIAVSAILALLLEAKAIDGFMNLLPELWEYASMSRLLEELLSLESQEAFDLWKPYGLLDLGLPLGEGSETAKVKRRDNISSASRYTSASLIRVVAGYPFRENLLLDFWEAAQLFKEKPEVFVAKALKCVVKNGVYPTRLLHYILDGGAPVNYVLRHNQTTTLTSLGVAAMNATPEGLEVAKLLLLHGADPTITGEGGSISDAPLPKKLGTGWSELVEQIQDQRRQQDGTTRSELH